MHSASDNPPAWGEDEAGVAKQLDQAQAALERGDAGAAIAILRLIVRRQLPSPLKMRHHYLSGWAEFEARHYLLAERELALALALAERLDERGAAARISYRLGTSYYRRHQFALAERCFVRAWLAIEAGEVGDLLFRMYVDHSLGNCALRQGRYVGAASHYRDALSYVSDVDDPKWSSSVYWGLGLAYLQYGEAALAKLALEESLALAERAASDSFLVEISAMYAVSLIELNQARAAERELERTIYLSRQVGNDRTLVLAYGCLAEAKLLDGRLVEALATAEQALVEAEKQRVDALDRAQVEQVLAKVLTAAGHRDEADHAYATAEQGMKKSGDNIKYANLLGDYARALMSWGEHERAAEKLEAALRLMWGI